MYIYVSFVISIYSAIPSIPRGPIKVFDVLKNSASISWNAPEDDGGSPITGYVLERKESVRSFWSQIDRVPANITSYNIKDLTEDTEYDFRVTAVNRVGNSDPLVTDLTTKIKSPFGKFSLFETFYVQFCTFIFENFFYYFLMI